MLGISLVISSGPSLVSLASISNSSMCIDVKRSSLTNFSLISMASSKLYPLHGINATSRFLPKASSPFLVAAPSAIISPASTRCPNWTNGLWFTHVEAFDL